MSSCRSSRWCWNRPWLSTGRLSVRWCAKQWQPAGQQRRRAEQQHHAQQWQPAGQQRRWAEQQQHTSVLQIITAPAASSAATAGELGPACHGATSAIRGSSAELYRRSGSEACI